MDLELHEKQSFALLLEATELLYGGAAGGGKSHLMRVAAILWCMEIAGLNVYIFRREYNDIIKNHMEGPTSFYALLSDLIDQGYAQIVDKEIRFWNGSKIFLCHCQHEKDMYGYHGAQIHVLMIDELTLFTEKVYRYLRGRVRLGGLQIPAKYKGLFPRIFCCTNPGNIGHNWVKRSFVDLDFLGTGKITQMPPAEGGKKRAYVRSLLSDNPSMLESDPDYEMTLDGLGNPELVKALKNGDWNIAAGGMFDDVWNPEKHIISAFKIPLGWRVDRSFDWGSSKPFSVCWWAESNGDPVVIDGKERCFKKGSIFLIGEWYGCKTGKENEGLDIVAGEIAEGIKQREPLICGCFAQPGPADGSIWDNVNGNCVVNDFESKGVYWIKSYKAGGSRKLGWLLIKKLLKAALSPIQEEPALYIFDTCTEWIRTVPTLPRCKKDNDDVDTAAEDHAGDATRYRLLTKENKISVGNYQ